MDGWTPAHRHMNTRQIKVNRFYFLLTVLKFLFFQLLTKATINHLNVTYGKTKTKTKKLPLCTITFENMQRYYMCTYKQYALIGQRLFFFFFANHESRTFVRRGGSYYQQQQMTYVQFTVSEWWGNKTQLKRYSCWV